MFSFAHRLCQVGKELTRIYPMGCIMRACVNTVRFIVIRAEVAGRGLGAYLGDFPAGTCRIVGLHLEGMHIDISIGTVAGAQAATDDPVPNCDFETVPP